MIVVDTNILVYRWLPGPRSIDADALVRLDPEWAAPFLWRSEMRNVLAGYIRAKQLSLIDAENVMRHAVAGLLGGEHLVADDVVFNLVAHSRRTAYDCEYAALARALGTVVVTEDRALITGFPKYCRSLSDAVRGNLS